MNNDNTTPSAPDPAAPLVTMPARPVVSAAMVEALARLELSRAQLRERMIPPPLPPPPPGAPSALLPARLRAWWRRLRRRGGGWPIAGVATAALGEWWQHHPWRPAGELLAGEWRATAAPLVRRHPVLIVLAAAGLGAFLVAQRPWRWPGVAERVRPMPARLGRFLLGQLSQAPVQTALLSLLMLLRKPADAPAPAGDTPRQPRPTSTPDGG